MIDPFWQIVFASAWALKGSPILMIGSAAIGALARAEWRDKALGAGYLLGLLYACLNAYMNSWWPGYWAFFAYTQGGAILGLAWCGLAMFGRFLFSRRPR